MSGFQLQADMYNSITPEEVAVKELKERVKELENKVKELQEENKEADYGGHNDNQRNNILNRFDGDSTGT